MASVEDVINMIDTLSNSGLDFTPNQRRLELMVDVWAQTFDDIPGDILKQAAADYLKTETKWPSPAKLRTLAVQVKSRGGQSVAPAHFEAKERQWRAAPVWARAIGDALLTEIGDLTTKKMDEWTGEDYERYEAAVGAPYGSPEEGQFWGRYLQGAYFIPQVEPPAHPQFKSWTEAAAWQEQQREAMRVRV